MPMQRQICLTLILLLAIAVHSFAESSIESPRLRIGRVAYNSPRDVLISHQALLQYLRAHKGLEKVELLLYSSYEKLHQQMMEENVEIGWTGTTFYSALSATSRNYEPMLAPRWRGKSSYSGQILVSRDSPFQTLSDLKGARMAFVSKDSSSGYLFPVLLLNQAGVKESDLGQVEFLAKHDSVAFALIARQFDAGATYAGVLEQDGLRDQADSLRVLAQTEPIPNEPLVFRRDLPSRIVEIFVNAIMDEASMPALRQIPALTGFDRIKDEDYDPVRRLIIQ